MRITCLFLLIGFSFLSSGQQLQGTYWETMIPGQGSQGLTHFTGDSVVQLAINLPPLVVMSYTEIGNDFYVRNKPGVEPCDTSVGHYTFTINNDTLSFVKVTDNCNNRRVILTSLWYVRSTFSLAEFPLENFVTIFPNPSKGFIHIRFSEELVSHEFIINNSIGQKLKSYKIENQEEFLDLTNFPNGIYYLTIPSKTASVIKISKY